MRLIQPSPGECMDRQSILELKMEAGQLKHINIVHFQNEHDVIQAYLERAWFPGVTPENGLQANEHYNELREVNKALWHLENGARDLIKVGFEFDARAGGILRQIVNLNDKRAALVGKINQLFGVTDQPEKLYS